MFGPSSEAKPPGWLRRVGYFRLALAALLLYAGGIIFFRWRENRNIDLEMERKASSKKAEADRRAVEMMGGNRFDILAFYVVPASIGRGEAAQLCYGVSNATSVRLDPPMEGLWPSYSRCLNVSPRKSTTYTLTAQDAQGQMRTATVLLRVR
jgi:hypothetical protein